MTKTYEKLLSESPAYLISPYGRSGVLGFKGTKDQIERAFNLFLNYDRSNIRLNWISGDLAYISISPARIRAAIKLFLYVNLLHSKEVKSYSNWDEDSGVYTLTQDTEAAELLSEEDATLFMNSLVNQSFVPSDESSVVEHEYAVVR